jgi:hypothetical protein
MEQIELLLTKLYTDYLAHKDDKNYKGMKHEELSEALIGRSKYRAQRMSTTRSTVWLLIPQFVNIRSYGYKQDARKYKLNEYGVKLVEVLIEEAKKPKPETENIEYDDYTDEEDENNEDII